MSDLKRLYVGDESPEPFKFTFNGEPAQLFITTGHLPEIDSSGFWRRIKVTEPQGLLLGMGGYLRSGKDTFADHLVELGGWVKMGMSDPLGDALLALNPIVDIGIDNAGESDRPMILRYDWLLNRVGYTEAKTNPEVRGLLQRLGTEVGRNMIGENTWTDIAVRNIKKHWAEGKGVILTGIRFPNELKIISDLGGWSIWVDRGGEPPSAHASENSITAKDFDRVVDNTNSLEALYASAEDVVRDLTDHLTDK